MSEISEERVEALASNILECHDVKPSEIKALAGLALLALRERAEPVVVPDLHKVVYAHLAPNHLTEHARQIDSILGFCVPNMSHTGNKEDLKEA